MMSKPLLSRRFKSQAPKVMVMEQAIIAENKRQQKEIEAQTSFYKNLKIKAEVDK